MLYTTLRMLHILAGIFWGGSNLFLWLILYPALKRAKVPAFSVRRAIPGVMLPLMAFTLIVLFGTGVWMTFILKGGDISTLLTNAWGWAVFISFLATLFIIVNGFLVMPAGWRMANLARQTAGRALTPEETAEFSKLTKRFYSTVATNIYYIVFTISLVAMLMLRYLA